MNGKFVKVSGPERLKMQLDSLWDQVVGATKCSRGQSWWQDPDAAALTVMGQSWEGHGTFKLPHQARQSIRVKQPCRWKNFLVLLFSKLDWSMFASFRIKTSKFFDHNP